MSHHRVWTGCIGKDYNEVIDLIKKENKEYNPIVVTLESQKLCTQEYRCNRVKIYVNNENKVIKEPCTG